MAAGRYRVGVSHDIREDDLRVATAFFEQRRGNGAVVEVERMPELPGGVATPQALDDFDAMLNLAVAIERASVAGLKRFAVIARTGVGYDRIDVPAITEAGVALAITPHGVRRPVAESVIALIFALAKNLFALDRLTRAGGWRAQVPRLNVDLAGKTLGTVGCGNIGAEVFRLARSLGFARLITNDPYVDPRIPAEVGAELVSLEEACRESDFLSINTPLNEETRGLIGGPQLALMRRTAFLINTARGGIVDEAALAAALREGRIAGAGIDVFEDEPPPKDHPFFSLENVILAPHAVAWSEALARDNITEACTNIVSLLFEGKPRFVVNPDVLDRPEFREKLARQGRT
jgi:phosphoglycerate dehydrogenase-like enzyme